MTRLVIHAGAEFADAGAVHRDLVSHRSELAAAGVVLPSRDDVPSWQQTAQGFFTLARSPLALDLLKRTRESDGGDLPGGSRGSGSSAGSDASAGSVAVISSDTFADALTSPDACARLVETAAAHDVDVTIVVVVRETIGYLNSLYCRRILNLDTARSFEKFASLATPAHRFDYVASFGSIADTEGLELVAIAYPDLLAKGAGRAVLEAAGVSPAGTDGLSLPTAHGPHLPGPVLIAATRLLNRRLRQLLVFEEEGRPRMRALVEQLSTHATSAGWDSTEFWGWDVPLRRAAAEEHAASNEMFAEFVWGTAWPEPYSVGPPVRADLAGLLPSQLRDVFDTVDRLVRSGMRNPQDD